MSNKRMTMEDINNLLYQSSITFTKDKDGYMIPYDIDHLPMDKETVLSLIKELGIYLERMDFKALKIEREKFLFEHFRKRDIDIPNTFYKNRKKSGIVYFLKRKDNMTKIGCTTNFKSRIKVLEREHGSLEVVHLVNSENYYITEAAFHLLFGNKCKGNEWFDLSQEDIDYVINNKYYKFIEETIKGKSLDPDLYFEEIIIGDINE